MTGLVNYLNIVGPVAAILVGLVLVAEIIKAFKVIYEFIASKVLKIQTKTAKKKERDEQITELILKNNLDLQDFMVNQSKFNDDIKQEIVSVRGDLRNGMEAMANDISSIKSDFTELSNTVTDMQIESMRETILEFASALSSPNNNVYTKEQFTYVKKIYNQYTKILKDKNRTDDEVDLSMIIINDRYEYNVLHHTFVEDLVKDPHVKQDIDEQMEKSKQKRSRKKTIEDKENKEE